MTKKAAQTQHQNFLMMLSGFLVVALGFMAYTIYSTPKEVNPLDLDDVVSLETNLESTDLKSLDSNMLLFENELK
jgi:hypothetical protein